MLGISSQVINTYKRDNQILEATIFQLIIKDVERIGKHFKHNDTFKIKILMQIHYSLQKGT